MNSVKEVYYHILDSLQNSFEKDGFRKKKLNQWIRKSGDCDQYITILFTKIRGCEQANLQYSIQYSFEKANRIIAYLKGEQYEKKWVTGAVNLSSLIKDNKVFSHSIDRGTKAELVADEVYTMTQKYGYAFWENYNTIEKFSNGLKEGKNIISLSTAGVNKREWNQIACYLILNEKEKAEQVIQTWSNHRPDTQVLEACLKKIEGFDLSLF